MEDNANSKRILLVNDMAGYGKVALAAMIPILSSAHHQVFNLPTALVSNTLDYGTFDILETTGYMRGAMDAWEKLGFEFDAVATGFLVSEEQTKLVADFCRARNETGATVFVDPIMGDEGALYNGLTEATVGFMCEKWGSADVVMPNFTEAAFLTGLFRERTVPGARCLTHAEAEELVAGMHGLGAAKVVVTSCAVDGEHTTLVSEGAGCELVVLPYDEVPVRFPGTTSSPPSSSPTCSAARGLSSRPGERWTSSATFSSGASTTKTSSRAFPSSFTSTALPRSARPRNTRTPTTPRRSPWLADPASR